MTLLFRTTTFPSAQLYVCGYVSFSTQVYIYIRVFKFNLVRVYYAFLTNIIIFVRFFCDSTTVYFDFFFLDLYLPTAIPKRIYVYNIILFNNSDVYFIPIGLYGDFLFVLSRYIITFSKFALNPFERLYLRI